jgi:ABC-type uncharacterized transport system involved in gliding motility auxiliary subunit
MRARLAEYAKLLLLLAALAGLGWVSARHAWQWDLSHAQRGTLAPASRAALAALDGPVEVTSYARASGDLRGRIAAFVAHYQRAKPDLRLSFVDPDADPGAMRARGITLDGELELRFAGRTQRLARLDEREFTQALKRLARADTARVSFIVGHGERRSDGEANHDLGRFAAALTADGLSIERIQLATAASIPDNAGLVVIASPQVPYSEVEAAAVVDWIERGGSLLWLAEPGAEDGLAPLARALGIAWLPGRIVDAAGQGLGVEDPSFVAITQYPPHPALRGLDLTTLFPQAAAVARLANAPFAATPLATTSARSWTETGPIEGAIAFDEGTGEVPGPLDLALALTRLSPGPDRHEQRIVVVGDGDFLSNRFLGNGGNRVLGTRLVHWLLGDEASGAIGVVEAPDARLDLSPSALGWIGLGLLVGLPAAIAGTGAAVLWRRRRRGGGSSAESDRA